MISLRSWRFGNTDSTTQRAKGIVIQGTAPFPELAAVLASMVAGVGLFYAFTFIFQLLIWIGVKV